jgi:hypothetical protein
MLHLIRRSSASRIGRSREPSLTIHRAYTVEEVAKLLQVHKNTVRGWLWTGLQAIDDRRPTLILGRQLAAFLHARRDQSRRRCRPDEFYCFRCRTPRASATGTAEYLRVTANSGNLKASCVECGTRMYRRVSLRKVATVVGDLQVLLPQAQQRIVEGVEPSLNCDLERETDAQP